MLIWFLSVTKSLTIDVILYDLASSQHIFSNILHILKMIGHLFCSFDISIVVIQLTSVFLLNKSLLTLSKPGCCSRCITIN